MNILQEHKTRLDEAYPGVFIEQFENGFSYGTDAVELASYVSFKRGAKGAELGTGTGIIPILICADKENKRCPEKIFAFEIQEKYAALSSSNVKRNGLEDKIEVICADMKNASRILGEKGIFSELDFVFSNPPYMKMDSGFLNETEDKLIARHEAAATIFDVCDAASRLLKHGGDFFVVYRPDRMCDLMCAMRESSLEPKDMVFISGRAGADPKLVLVKAKKGAASGNKIHCKALR